MALMTGFVLVLSMLISGIFTSATMHDSTRFEMNSGRWLISYKGRSGYDVAQDPRFLALVQECLPHYGPAYSRKTPLAQLVKLAIWNDPSSVTVESNRFVTITGEMPSEADVKGLLWFDAGAQPASAMIFVVMSLEDVGREGKASLSIYTNQRDTTSSLPPQFIASLLSWEKKKQMKIVKIELHDALNESASLPLSVFAN